MPGPADHIVNPCPFCESKDLGVTYAQAWVVYCEECGASGPESDDADEAVAKWDRLCPSAFEAAKPSPYAGPG